MKVPFLNLQAQHDAIHGEVMESLRAVVSACAFAGGPFVEKFEQEFASFCGCREAVGVGSGTDALWLALAALGVGAGDEVITVANSFIATAEAISLCGAAPVFVDVTDSCYTMNPSLLEAAITARTKVIIPVHLFGQTADMDAIAAIAAKHGLAVLEDACQAHGAQYKGRRAGSMGAAGCFSFYPGKNLGAFGEAGCVVTDDHALAARIRLLRDHGQSQRYHHALVGVNARMDGVQGAILSVKLKYLPVWNEARAQHAQTYRSLLEGAAEVVLPEETAYGSHVYHLFVIRHPSRDSLLQALASRGVTCGIHYPVPIHLQPAYSFLGIGRGSLPVAERCAEEVLSLPIFPELSREQIGYVAQAVRDCSAGGGAS